MSADNWAQCPRCVKEHHDYLDQRQALVQRSYGTVSAADFLALKATVDQEMATEFENTLREDYQLGIYDEMGTHKFFVNYNGRCKTCDFHFQYEYETDPMKPKEGAKAQ